MSMSTESREGIDLSPESVRFRLGGGKNPLILVPVHLDGKGPYEFILDTGASHSLLSPELAETLGVPPEFEKHGTGAAGPVTVAFGHVGSLAVGSAQRRNVPVAITNELNRIGAAMGNRVDGCLGFEFLKDFVLTIDYRDSTLRFASSPEPGNSPPARSIPFALAAAHKPLILVQAFVNDQGPFQFAVDTGASRTMLSSELAAKLALETRQDRPLTGAGGQVQMSTCKVDLLAVGDVSVRDHDVGVGAFLTMLSEAVGTRLDGILGYDFLNQFRVTISYPQGTLELLPAGPQ